MFFLAGIPVHHQNLLYGYKEVHDSDRLCDVGIENGSKLRLVLSMRGGPISMRRLSALDHYCILKDLTELFEHTRYVPTYILACPEAQQSGVYL